ncbi:MAG: ABC transporter substrate-binding protein [Gammaproteobacteria bacterium]|nr:ABC transporter substrate-binding protein [Gammaproteobacteria bacterium]
MGFGLEPASSQSPTTFTIGGVVPLSGAYALLGTSMQKGADVAIEQRGRLLGVPVKAVWEDSETKPQTSVQKANKLLSGGVNILFGDGSSGQTLAIMPLANQRKVLLLVTTSAADQITGANRNRYTFRTSSLVFKETRMAIEYVKKARFKSVYGLAVDQPVGRDTWSMMKASLKELGVASAGEDFAPIGSQDYSIIIDKISKSGADSVFVVTTGADTITFLKQAGQVKLNSRIPVFGTGFLDDDAAAAVGPDVVGVKTVARYHFSYDSPANRRFVEAYRKKYNEWPNAYAGHAYDGLNWLFDVVEKTGSWDVEKWVAAFENSSHPDSVFGPTKMRACDHQAIGVGLWAEAVKGQPPQPALMLKVTDTFAPDNIYPACPK